MKVFGKALIVMASFGSFGFVWVKRQFPFPVHYEGNCTTTGSWSEVSFTKCLCELSVKKYFYHRYTMKQKCHDNSGFIFPWTTSVSVFLRETSDFVFL